jgi:hypothetical protein
LEAGKQPPRFFIKIGLRAKDYAKIKKDWSGLQRLISYDEN